MILNMKSSRTLADWLEILSDPKLTSVLHKWKWQLYRNRRISKPILFLLLD